MSNYTWDFSTMEEIEQALHVVDKRSTPNGNERPGESWHTRIARETSLRYEIARRLRDGLLVSSEAAGARKDVNKPELIYVSIGGIEYPLTSGKFPSMTKKDAAILRALLELVTENSRDQDSL